jgi:hypothetical protein
VSTDDGHLTATEFAEKHFGRLLELSADDGDITATEFTEKHFGRTWGLNLGDGVAYWEMCISDIPPACVGVPVVLDDHRGELIAGLSAYQISSSEDLARSHSGERDSVRPVIGWWLSTRVAKQ